MADLEEKIDALSLDMQVFKMEAELRTQKVERVETILVGENGDGGLLKQVQELAAYVKIATWILGIVGTAFVVNTVTFVLGAVHK